uniref:DUF155 domain-containing protein n=2 Tax=Dunaliella tertiolecta TaxID=3047 RepID=A0A7S3QNM5_DUNTE|mmetsp:Transcript_22584/g.62385  ORF Transcript_22584/g.62385 Transcript_22584/m.62385 type:complete len:411 (-) Transcript_22584:1189-2421(-)
MKKGDSPLQVPLLPTTQPRSRSSPAPSHGRTQATRRQQATIAPGQPLPTGRQKDKFVPLPEEADAEEQAAQAAAAEVLAPHPTQVPLEWHERPAIFEDLPQLGVLPPPLPDSSKRGRATLYCIAESFDRKKLEELLKLTYPAEQVLSYPDVFYVEYIKGSGDQPGGDVFFFDYGVVACWGLTKSQEMTIVRGMARQCNVQGLSDSEIETDEYEYNFTTTEKPHVQNDTVTLHKRFAQNHKMKLAVSYALAQSTKLSVYEQRVVDIVLETKNLPESLAMTGALEISSTDIAKLIGKVFLQKSTVNLLSSVLDTPEFFWHAPDNFQTLYERVNEYLELPARVELLNSRFSVLQEMLDMVRNHQNNYHNVRLEWIVIWLIVVEVVVGLFELLGLFGLVGVENSGASSRTGSSI